MNLNREFEMARRKAVTYLDRKDQKTEIKRTKDNMTWSINLLPKKLPHDQINKVGKSYTKVCDFIWTHL